ncbi:MAG: flp pilus-assembly TadE/G-like family protein [Microthrixaceae bacterium]
MSSRSACGRHHGDNRDSGAGSILLVALLVVIAAVLAALVQLGGVGIRRARIQVVADLVALSEAAALPGGFHPGRSVAGPLAERNGATLTSVAVSGETVRIRVAGGGEVATAAASLEDVAGEADDPR